MVCMLYYKHCDLALGTSLGALQIVTPRNISEREDLSFPSSAIQNLGFLGDGKVA